MNNNHNNTELPEMPAMSFEQIKEAHGALELVGFDDPFSTYSWEYWLKIQGLMAGGFARFQRAIERHDIAQANFVLIEMQMILLDLGKEAAAWGVLGQSRETTFSIPQ